MNKRRKVIIIFVSMKRFVLAILVGILGNYCSRGQTVSEDSLRLMFWNVENFFDWRDESGLGSDNEFSSAGKRRWTRKRFQAKANAIAKTILWEADRCGRVPDLVAFAELENAFVLRQLIYNTALKRFAYSHVHYDSPDPRGIDVGIIFRKETLDTVHSFICRIEDFKTRDILCLKAAAKSGEQFHFLVNHHPSKYGGANSSPKRVAVMKKMSTLADSLMTGAPVVAMGDFNDNPDGEAFAFLSTGLDNQAVKLYERGEGTIRFNGKWELIDMFLTDKRILHGEMDILYPSFLMVKDSAHSGYKPFRTYSGPRWIGGVSDHLPIAITIRY